MPNPLFGNNTSPNGATAPTDPLYDTPKKYARGYNKFNLTRTFYNTERYADINVVDVVEGVEGDRLPFGNKHEIRSYTLKSPMMFDIYKKKAYFLVDNKAILPINWEKVYKQPNKGDDVNDDVNCVCDLLRYMRLLKENGFNTATGYDINKLTNILKRVLLFESIFSDGSLLSSMNCHLSSYLVCKNEDNERISFDQLLQSIYDKLPDSIGFSIPSLGTFRYYEDTSPVAPNITRIAEKRVVFDMLRTYADWRFYTSDDQDSLISWFNYIGEAFRTRVSFAYDIDEVEDEDTRLNLSRLVAYQLCCNQFYTRDSVDNVYNAELFMQNARDIAFQAITLGDELVSNAPWPKFLYNGSYIEYDVFSGRVIDKMMNIFANATNLDVFNDAYAYLHMLFFYRKSLRYGDYFVAAKTLPYAPGDVTADVVGNGVSALDMTRSLLMQRFLNSVERARNTWKDYLKDVTDGIAPPNPLEPRFLASTTSVVGGFEVENTAENQGAIVSLLKSSNSNYIYEVEVGSPCIIIGVSTYEIPRVYSKTVDKFFRHRDRFDMFNKFMQNIGDQEISNSERSAFFSPSDIFGYQPRHMEYKKRYPIASGGFIENLPGYAFITDNVQSGQQDNEFDSVGREIGSAYIRNKNSEMDRFYASLSGLTLASYFHFICKYDCICHASRKMDYSPSIL